MQQTIDHWRDRIAQVVPDQPDLIVLPEFCDRPSDNLDVDEYYRVRGDQVKEAVAALAAEHHTYIAYAALRVDDSGTKRNSVQILDRHGGLAGVYDKHFLTDSEILEHGRVPGVVAPVFELDFGTVGCVICFDLNFDELKDSYADQQPDLLLFCSAFHGSHLQQRWAYDVGSYFVAAVYPPAPSQIYSPLGQQLAATTNYFDEITVQLNLDRLVIHLDHHWEKLRAMKEKYGSEVRIVDPGLLGSVLITSESSARTVADLAAEFELMPTRAYLDRSRALRDDAIQNHRTQPRT